MRWSASKKLRQQTRVSKTRPINFRSCEEILTTPITKTLGAGPAILAIRVKILCVRRSFEADATRRRIARIGQRVAQGESASPGYAALNHSPRTRGRQRVAQGESASPGYAALNHKSPRTRGRQQR